MPPGASSLLRMNISEPSTTTPATTAITAIAKTVTTGLGRLEAPQCQHERAK
jgi:hypothetical protein